MAESWFIPGLHGLMKKSTQQLYTERILSVLVFIQKNLDDDFKAEDDVGVRTISGGEYAVTTHVGPYNTLGQTYAKLLGQWLPRSGRELRSEPSLEFYLNAPDSTDPQDLLTDIYAPLEPPL